MRTLIIAVLLTGCFVPALHAADPLDSLALVYDDGMGGTLPYRLFLPPGYDEPGAEFPLVLYLHGAGHQGDDNLRHVSLFIDGLIDATQGERFASFLLAPQTPRSWAVGGGEISLSMQLTIDIIALLETQYQIDPSRRYVTGLSDGAFGTFDLIAKRSGMFAAAVPMSGGGALSRAADMVDTPLWVFHGREDSTVSVERSREMVAAIFAAGGDPLYTETRDSHDIWAPIYDDPIDELYPWMFEGVAPPLATLIYNSVTGNVSIDASTAPGGVIEHFRLYTYDPLNLTDDIVIDGVTLIHNGSTRLIYDDRGNGGFSTVADLGNIMAPGHDLSSLADDLVSYWYLSPETGVAFGNDRSFRLKVVIPEPTSVMLLVGGLTLLVLRRRHH